MYRLLLFTEDLPSFCNTFISESATVFQKNEVTVYIYGDSLSIDAYTKLQEAKLSMVVGKNPAKDRKTIELLSVGARMEDKEPLIFYQSYDKITKQCCEQFHIPCYTLEEFFNLQQPKRKEKKKKEVSLIEKTEPEEPSKQPELKQETKRGRKPKTEPFKPSQMELIKDYIPTKEGITKLQDFLSKVDIGDLTKNRLLNEDLSKVCICFRDAKNKEELFSLWKTNFGAPFAQKIADTLDDKTWKQIKNTIR